MPADDDVIVSGEWRRICRLSRRGLVMIIGASDTGKSTLARWLFERWSGWETDSVAYLDGDPGQSRLGPPASVTLSVGAPGTYGKRRFYLTRRFVGSTTPRGRMLPLLIAVARLIECARARSVDTIIYDTTGLIDPRQGGTDLKQAKVDLLHPELVIAIRRGKELEPLLRPLRCRLGARLVELSPAPATRRRNRSVRQRHRARRFAEYFSRARLLEVDLESFAMIPRVPLVSHQLLGFEDRQGFMLAEGIAMPGMGGESRPIILTPLRSLTSVRAIRLAPMTVDPLSFQDLLLGPLQPASLTDEEDDPVCGP